MDNDDDKVLWIVLTFCIITPVVMVALWAYHDKYFPPMLISVLLGISVAALTYRYLGGTSGAQFSVGALKVAGSAALVFGMTYLTNEKLSLQMSKDNPPNSYQQAMQELSVNKREYEDLQSEFESLKKEKESSILDKVKTIDPASETADELIEMYKNREGPFSTLKRMIDVKVTVINIPTNTFNACSELKLANENVQFVKTDPNTDGEILKAGASQAGIIEESVCKKKNRRFDIQISCEDGKKLFPEEISGCSNETGVGWKIPNGTRVFNISAEVRAS